MVRYMSKSEVKKDKESTSINQAINTIRNSYSTQIELLQEILKAGGGTLYGVDRAVLNIQ